MLDKAVLRRPGRKLFRDDVEGLALTLAKYSEVLKKASADATARQSLDHVVRPLSQYSDIELRSSHASECAHAESKEESNLQLTLDDAGDWQPVEFDAVAVLCEYVTAMQWHRFLQSF